MKEQIDDMDFIKIRNLYSLNDTVKITRRQATAWEKILANHIFGRSYSHNL
jgi:hypothetical protein